MMLAMLGLHLPYLLAVDNASWINRDPKYDGLSINVSNPVSMGGNTAVLKLVRQHKRSLQVSMSSQTNKSHLANLMLKAPGFPSFSIDYSLAMVIVMKSQ